MDRSILLLSRHTLAMSTTRSQRRGQNYDRKRTRRARSWLTTTTAAFALSGITGASARDIVYCSDVNTGSDSSPNTSTYQSNGLCYDTCNAGSYAFAILQGQDCWCSNYVPATDASGCNDPCPGYPSDTCGNMQKNLYGYMALPNKPSGTKGADTTVSTTSPHPITSTVTAKGPTETMIIVSTKTPTKAQTTSSPTTTSLTQKATATQDQIVVTTVAGGFKTIIISASGSTKVPSATALPSANNSDFFSNAGRVAGLIIGLILVLFLIVAGVLFYRRRQAMRRSELYAPGSTGGVIPAGGAGFFGSGKRGRSMSTLGLVGEKTPPASSTPPLGANGATVAAPQTAGETTPQVGEVYDQRLDPGSLFMRFDHRTGSSRVSVRSLRDDQDYSRRVLRLANPDD